jgi:hypothetical protein
VNKEYILCAAIFLNNPDCIRHHYNNYHGIIICGYRRNDCIIILNELKNKDGLQLQGFLTSRNRFVERNEAYKIAKEANQIITKKEAPHNPPGILYSEDLY